jgi:hypothetical protein
MFGELHGRMNICSWPPSVEKTRPVSVEVDTVHLSQFKLMTPRKGTPEKSTGISLIVATISGFTHSPGLVGDGAEGAGPPSMIIRDVHQVTLTSGGKDAVQALKYVK